MRYIIILLFILFSKFSYSQDTIKVVMLYSDSAITTLYGIGENGEEYEEFGLDVFCYWKKGYKVGNEYLDIDKKRVPSSNIIWFHKKLK